MRLRRCIWSFAIFVALSQISFAQTSDWAVVANLSRGQKVKVVTADGKSHVGNINLVSNDSLRIGKKQLFQKQDVQQVFLMGANHRGRNALIGLGAGAAVGLATAMSCTGQGFDWTKKECAAIAIPFAGALGAGVGALVPSFGRWQEVYRTK